MTALGWADYARGGDADPEMIFGPENETPAARRRRTLVTPCSGQYDLFFGREGEYLPERLTRSAQAKALCAACPAQPGCLEYALTSGQQYGIWAGLDEEELAAERRRLTTAQGVAV